MVGKNVHASMNLTFATTWMSEWVWLCVCGAFLVGRLKQTGMSVRNKNVDFDPLITQYGQETKIWATFTQTFLST